MNDLSTEKNLAAFIAREIRKHDNLEYWNTEEWLGNEIKIYDTAIEQGIINQDWLDDRINCHAFECLGFLLNVMKNNLLAKIYAICPNSWAMLTDGSLEEEYTTLGEQIEALQECLEALTNE